MSIFSTASSIMTLVSFMTFAGILWWTWSRTDEELTTAANLPFADEENNNG